MSVFKLPEFCAGFRNFKQDIKATGIGKFHFIKSEWSSFRQPEKVSVPYMVWRGVFMSFLCFAALNSFVAPQAGGKKFWLIYLTNWSLLTQLIYSVLFFVDHLIACICLDRASKNQKNTQEAVSVVMIATAEINLSVSEKENLDTDEENAVSLKNVGSSSLSLLETAIWILFNIVATLPILVTLGYWLTVYNPQVHGPKIHRGNYNTVMVHGINALFALVDSMVVAIPVRVTHFVYLLAFILTYILVSILFEVGIGVYPYPEKPYIYPLLKWRDKPYWTVLSCFVGMLVCSAMHFFLWLRYVFRLFLVSKISCRNRNYKANVYAHHA